MTGQKKAEKALENGALRRGIGVGTPRLSMLVSGFSYFEGRLLLSKLVATIVVRFPQKSKKRKIPTARCSGENALLRSLTFCVRVRVGESI